MGFPPGSTMDAAVYHRAMVRDPMRALVGARAVRKRAGEHALARAVGDEHGAEAVVAAAVAQRDAAAAAVSAARAEVEALLERGAGAGAGERARARGEVDDHR